MVVSRRLQLKASAAMFDDVCTHVSSYLKANQYRLSRSQYDGTSIMFSSQVAREEIAYGSALVSAVGLVEMLIFHGLVPLGKYDHALYMVENNKKLSSARRKVRAPKISVLLSSSLFWRRNPILFCTHICKQKRHLRNAF